MSFRVVHKVSDRPSPVWSVTAGANGLLITGDSSGQLETWRWDEGNGLERKSSLREGEESSGENGGILSIECESMEEDRFFSVSMGGDVSLWDAKEGKRVVSLKGAPLEVWCTTTLAGKSGEKEEKGNRNLITGGANGRIAVFVPESGRVEQVISAGKRHLHCMASEPRSENIIVCGDAEGVVRVIDLRTGSTIRSYDAHRGIARCVDFSPDGKRIFSGGDDAMVQVFHMEEGKIIRSFDEHDGASVFSLQCMHNRCASGGADCMVQLWDSHSGEHEYMFEGHSDCVWDLSFFDEGKHIVSVSQDKSIMVSEVALQGLEDI